MDSALAVLSRFRRPGRVWIDLLVLLVLLGGVNFLTHPGQPGWFSVQPNPYLLIPVLIGGRYGSGAGVYSSLVCVGWLGFCDWFGSSAFEPKLFLNEHSVLLLALFVFGLAAGEVQGFFRRKAGQLEVLLAGASERLTALDRDLQRISTINRELQERLLVNDNRTFAIDVEIRSLYECRVDELWERALGILARIEEVGCAAIYAAPDQAESLPRRKASIGADDRLGEHMDPVRYPLVGEALRRGEMVVLPDWLEGGADPSAEPFLFAKPISGGDGEWFGLLVVSRMPFLHFDVRSLSRIDLTVDWIGEILDLRLRGAGKFRMIDGVENKKLLTESHFKRMLELSLSAWQKLRVPSGLVVARLDGGEDSEAFLRSVNRRVRTGDFLFTVEDTLPNAIILLPFTPERGTTIFVESCESMLKENFPVQTVTVEALPIKDSSDLSSVWREIEERVSR